MRNIFQTKLPPKTLGNSDTITDFFYKTKSEMFKCGEISESDKEKLKYIEDILTSTSDEISKKIEKYPDSKSPPDDNLYPELQPEGATKKSKKKRNKKKKKKICLLLDPDEEKELTEEEKKLYLNEISSI